VLLPRWLWMKTEPRNHSPTTPTEMRMAGKEPSHAVMREMVLVASVA